MGLIARHHRHTRISSRQGISVWCSQPGGTRFEYFDSYLRTMNISVGRYLKASFPRTCSLLETHHRPPSAMVGYCLYELLRVWLVVFYPNPNGWLSGIGKYLDNGCWPDGERRTLIYAGLADILTFSLCDKYYVTVANLDDISTIVYPST